MIDNPSSFRQAMEADGLTPGDIIPGRLHRFPGIGKKNGNPAGWCKMFDDGLGAVYGDFSTGLFKTWQAEQVEAYTPEQKAAFRAKVAESRRQAEQAQKERQAEAASVAAGILQAANGNPAQHPYFLKKGVPMGDLVRRGPWPQRGWDDALLFPIYASSGGVTSIQAISADGDKDFLSGGRIKGCLYPLGKISGSTGRIVLGEGIATVASVCLVMQCPGAAAMSAGNLELVAKTIKKLAPGAEIIIVADDDQKEDGSNPGKDAAQKAAACIGCKWVIPDLGKKADAWDVWHELDAEGIKAMMAAAKETSLDRAKGAKGAKTPGNTKKSAGLKLGYSGLKLPDDKVEVLLSHARKLLAPTADSVPEYPVDALGPLADACLIIAKHGQVHEAMAGQCLLTTAALLAQSVADVRTLAGVKPVSLFSMTLADSGDGKSTVEEATLRRVRDRQKRDGRAYREALAAITGGSRKKNEPSADLPPEPYRIMKDGTVEGIRRSFKEGLCAQGCFTSEAAVVLGGYGMSAEHRGKSAGNLNALWDDGEISVARGGESRLQLYDRRLSIHWLVQPLVARQAIHDPMLSAIGFWPRFLLAVPPPSPPLRALEFKPEDHPAIRRFWDRCRDLLDRPTAEDCSGNAIIQANQEAMELAKRFYEKMQIEAKRGSLQEVKPFAVRATEQAFRIAAVLAVFQGRESIELEIMRHGITLATYSVLAWQSVFGGQEENADRELALVLYAWILKQNGFQATETAILQIGPKPIRSRNRRDTALAMLQQAGLVGDERGTWYALNQEESNAN